MRQRDIWRNVWDETPKKYVFAIGIISSALIFFMFFYTDWMPIPYDVWFDPRFRRYVHDPLWGERNISHPYVHRLHIGNIFSELLSAMLGLVCLVLCAVRKIYKLGNEDSFPMAIFLILFSLSQTDFLYILIPRIGYGSVLYIHSIAFYAYPIPLFLFFFYSLRTSFQRWMWPLVMLPALIAAIALPLTLIFGRSILGAWMHTELSTVCFIVFLSLGMVGIEKKTKRYFIIVVSVFWGVWISANILMSQLSIRPLYRHSMFVDAVAISAGIIVAYILFSVMKELYTYKSEEKRLLDNARMLDERFKDIAKHREKSAETAHDMKTHLIAMRILFDGGDYKGLDSYLEKLTAARTSKSDESISCGNHFVEAILAYYAKQAMQIGVEIDFDIEWLPPLPVDESDLSSILGNLMDNALEGCSTIKEQEERKLAITIKCRRSSLCISVKNSFSGELKRRGGKYFTTKSDSYFHGNGVKIISEKAKKYNGFAIFDHTENMFRADVVLDILAKNESSDDD